MNFATITAIHPDGVTLSFDDGSTSTKHYKCNSSIVFRIGDRVRIAEDRGTHVVEYPVGAPIGSLAADSAAEANTATRHVGTTLSFFDGSTTTQKTVAALSGSATLAQAVTKINELLTALKAYGLIK